MCACLCVAENSSCVVAQIWSFDGFNAQLEFDIMPGSTSSAPRLLTAVNTELFMIATVPVNGAQLVVLSSASPTASVSPTPSRSATSSGLAWGYLSFGSIEQNSMFL